MGTSFEAIRRNDGAGSSITAELKYRAKEAGAGASTLGSPGASQRPRDLRTVRIHNARELTDKLSVETHGFTMVSQASALSNLWNQEEVNRVYRVEIEDLVKSLTGAETVLTFRWKWRSAAAEKRADVFVEDPTSGAPHIDYTEETVRCFAREIAGDEQAERLLSHRHALINVWRPITPVESSPLALCDPQTVDAADLLLNEAQPQPQNGVFAFPLIGYNLTFNPAHRWYYFPRLQPAEALVFKLCDSDPGKPQLTAHTGITDPTSPPDAAPRESLEIRTIAFYPD